jgi:glutamate-5-semialdehyde dehydrogenase
MIKHLDGICHVYIDDKADLQKALDVAFNAKCHRYGTCNTMETLLVAEGIAAQVLPPLAKLYEAKQVELRCDPAAQRFWRATLISRKPPKKTGAQNIWRRCWRSKSSRISMRR